MRALVVTFFVFFRIDFQNAATDLGLKLRFVIL